MSFNNSVNAARGESRLFSWWMLLTAIFLEILALSVLQVLQESHPILGAVILLALMNLSYFCMSLCLKQIAVGVAYATWEIVGGIGVLLISFIFFHPQLSQTQLAGIFLGFAGIICVILGEKHS